MCTVTYIPIQNNSFILTSNRDETPKRQPQELFFDASKNLLYPKEPKYGGSWICVSGDNRAICLLNGAFEKHQHKPPYRKSRGLVVLDFFESDSHDFFNSYDLNGIEPFTLIVAHEIELYELRWDGTTRYFKQLDTGKSHIWSSSTLYNNEIKKLREDWFCNWLSEHDTLKADDILDFHLTAGDGDAENALCMNRNNSQVCTVSITQVIKSQTCFEVKYVDIVKSDNTSYQMSLLNFSK